MAKRRHQSAAITALILLQGVSSGSAFAFPDHSSASFITTRETRQPGPQLPAASQQNRQQIATSSTREDSRLNMMSVEHQQSIDTLLQYTPLHLSSITPTPEMEAEILGDMSHVLWDVVPLLGAPTLMFRLSILLGRLFSMESNYISDRMFVTDDLYFDVPLLGLSIFLVWRSLAPILKAVLLTKPSALDKIAFEQLFQPVGINWLQFRTMLASCLDWVWLEPGQVLECESEGFNATTSEKEYLYWLYEGDVTGYYEGNFLTNIERKDGKPIDDPSAVGLLADMKFLYNLDLKQKMKTQSDVEVVKYPMATFRVGKRGATLMRIEAEQLYDLMEHDEHMEKSIRNLLLKSLQRKVGLLLRSRSEEKQQKDPWKQFEEEVSLPQEMHP